jgi:hypothetical protein
MVKIENWTMVSNLDPYKPPEMQVARLQGFAYGHPRFEDGTFITTSRLIDLDIPNGSAKTSSGSDYVLGQPSADWIDWLKENGFTKYTDDLEKLVSHILN